MGSSGMFWHGESSGKVTSSTGGTRSNVSCPKGHGVGLQRRKARTSKRHRRPRGAGISGGAGYIYDTC